jgi:hypothetical protein
MSSSIAIARADHRFAMFLEFDGERFRYQRNYDCFEPF